jgi:hypothetical protein
MVNKPKQRPSKKARARQKAHNQILRPPHDDSDSVEVMDAYPPSPEPSFVYRYFTVIILASITLIFCIGYYVAHR